MKKFPLFTLAGIFLICFISFWIIVHDGYDRQNKIILFIKKIIPSHLARKVRDTVFIIPNLKERNKVLSLQVEKYEQGLQGKLFKEEIIKSNNKKSFSIKEFFLPFPRLDIRLGWAATENSKRAHYLEIIDNKVLVISGLGQTIFFQKQNIDKKKLDQIEIKNNINNFLKNNDYELIGIRDLFVEDDYVYISIQHKDVNGFTVNVYRAKLDFEELDFKPFFITNEYWPEYNVFSGGRIETYKDNKILFSIGYSNVQSAAQNKDSLLGKIIAIDKQTSDHELISIGHRNPQGLFFDKDSDTIINAEHGPKGGDEININPQNFDETPNYGWDIASYGAPYTGKDNFKKSHSKYGFVEPFRQYTPSIGISEILYLSKRKNLDKTKNNLYVSSLRAGSVYIIEIDSKFSKIIEEDRVFFNEQRIRDIEFDEELGVFFLLFEKTPSIGILYSKN
jgi:glucose/arabinose dehydrogenase